MNEYEKQNMRGVSVSNAQGLCVVCLRAPATDRHHVVFRSAGGGDGPMLSLCRECHERAHQRRLHFRWVDGKWQWGRNPGDNPGGYDVSVARGGHWEYLFTRSATKYADALKSRLWRPLRHPRKNPPC